MQKLSGIYHSLIYFRLECAVHWNSDFHLDNIIKLYGLVPDMLLLEVCYCFVFIVFTSTSDAVQLMSNTVI